MQRAWMYLENIFSSPEIRKTLAKEDSLFQNVDKQFRMLMVKVNKNS